MRLRRVITFKEKKIEIKIMTTKLKNIIPSIWNWRMKLKMTKFFTKQTKKKKWKFKEWGAHWRT